MTKRAPGQFGRRASDFYPTPAAAVVPLIPHLHRTGVKTFAEPCSGEGDLMRHLEAAGFDCIIDADITYGADARDWSQVSYAGVDAVITNPPWGAKLMMEIMERQSMFVPAWFLIYSDWLFTHQSAQWVDELCTDIVPIGRVKWFPESKSVGFDNCCWIRMDAENTQPAIFWPMTK
jgi:hypothetical protein